jgi:hypothetical protein
VDFATAIVLTIETIGFGQPVKITKSPDHRNRCMRIVSTSYSTSDLFHQNG